MAGSGGAAAAAGLQFQYLYTIGILLDFLDDTDSIRRVVTVEDIRPVDSTMRTMDFSVQRGDADESFVEVKYRSTSGMRLLAALDGLVRMVEFGDAREYIFVSNTGRSGDFDAVNAVLGSTDSDAEVRRRLVALSGRAAVADTIRALDTALLTRLRRGRVEVVGVDLDAIYEQVKTRVASWRRRHGIALGAEAAEILMGRLIATVFDRAAHAPQSTVSLAEFEQMLATGPFVLAQAVGVDESGLGIGQVPRASSITRTALDGKLEDALNDGICTQQVTFCALHGRSGIGKSRLAASYAHRHRYAYDRILWLNAANNDTLAASVTARGWLLGIADGDLSHEQLAERFRTALAQFPGTWLVVFDDATSAAALRQWLPSAGWGHVLVTSLARGGWQEFTRIEVDIMQAHEARDLLSSRMGIADPSAMHGLDTELDQLAAGLGYWPLALEIAASYIGPLHTATQSITSYLEEIKSYAIGDDTLDIPDYPRPLLAAISMCIDRIDAQAATHRPAAIARRMLTMCSYFAYREIPTDLVHQFALSTVDEALADAAHDRPPHRQDPLAPLRASCAVLNSVSIVDFSTHHGPKIRPELSSRIEISDIVQRILRQRVDPTKALETAGLQLSNWLYYYITICGDYASAITVAQHAGSLLLHVRNPDDAPREVAAVAGNLAHLHRVRGHLDTAATLLHYELAVLYRHWHGPENVIKTTMALLDVLREGRADEQEILVTAHDLLDFVDDVSHVVPAELAAEARLAAEEVGLALRRGAMLQNRPADVYDQLLDRCGASLTNAPTTPETERAGMHTDLLQRFDDSPRSDEIDLAQRYLDAHPTHDVLRRMIAQAMVIEALVRAGQFTEALSMLSDLRHKALDEPHLLVEIPARLLNAVLDVIEHVAFQHAPAPDLVELTASLLDVAALFHLDTYDRYRHMIYTGALLAATGQAVGAQQISLLLADTAIPDLPHGVGSHRGHLLLRHWIDHHAATTAAGIEALPVEVAGLSFGTGLAADLSETRICVLHLNDEDYEKVRSRSPNPRILCHMTVHPDETGDPVAISVVSKTGTAICVILLNPGQLHRRFDHAIICSIAETPVNPGAIKGTAAQVYANVSWQVR